MSDKLPRAIRLLSIHGEAALRATMDKGKYIKPMIPKRIAANLRKRAIEEGTFGAFEPDMGGWNPVWDGEKKMHILKSYKGHARERDRPDRARKVTEAMKGMPDRLKKLRQDVEDRKPKQDITYLFKRVLAMAPKLNTTGKGSGYVSSKK
jgi:hypothetical protein